MAYWPGSGNSLNNIDYSNLQVGIVQHFLNTSSHLTIQVKDIVIYFAMCFL